ncbi:PREDICTED: chondroadherin-like [Gekko japonicus]|uniref:Chondroadherin-like n=1 Tax=Gekko japonicus TaxID=146911 RepID=A0ABM1KLR1_GEKJA|nr:PREDICTED: chondroadherin-like [Gekko japonicus]
MAQYWSNIFMLLLRALIFAPQALLHGFQCPISCSCSFSEWFVKCSNASLSSLPSGIPHTTVELDLQFNQFNSLREDTFPDLLELSTLYLGNSQVRQIEPGAFQGVRNLYHLYLDNCLLEEIPGGVFENLTNLAFLHLEHNCIAYISPGAFSSLKRLSSLDLSYNRLTELSDQALRGLEQLRQLHLSTNLIANLSARALPGKLRTLYLDQNQLDKVPGTIRTSTTLSTLHLSGNHISQLTSLSFGRKLRSLKQLFLDNLDLKKIATLAFKRLRRLEVLSLRNNSLESLPSLESLKYLSILYLTGNKWQCDCNLIWLRTWQKKAMRKERSLVECGSPKALQGQLLVNTELQKLTCPPFQIDSAFNSSANTALKTTIPPNERLLPQATTAQTTTAATFTTLITSRIISTARTSTQNNYHVLEKYDPCLPNHISSIHTQEKGDTALVVTWSSSGDHDQFEVRCKSAVDEQILRVTGGLTEMEFHHLQPGTEYRICIIPQNDNLLKCVAPTAQQCTSGHTRTHPVPQHRSLALGIGVTASILALMALPLFAFYRQRFQQIQFRRYYDEDSPSFQCQGIPQSKLTTEPVYETL